MMRREFLRRPSRAAHLALAPSVFAPVLAGTAILAHRFGFLSGANFILVLLTAVAFSLAGAVLALLGLRALWQEAAVGGRRSGLALLLCAPVLVPAAASVWLFQTTAPLSDISTDPLDPPHFSSTAPSGPGMNANEPPRLVPLVQKQFYENITGRRYRLSADAIAGHVDALAAELGWQVRPGSPRQDGPGEWTLEASAKTHVMGFVDDVIVRVTDEGESAYVDMRSASRFGARNFGANARRIAEFMNALDLRIQTGTSG